MIAIQRERVSIVIVSITRVSIERVSIVIVSIEGVSIVIVSRLQSAVSARPMRFRSDM